jgi:L-threonylcarbamoyladenylate synthase
MLNRIGASQLKKIKLHLKKGGVIAYPTESCYGLGCDPFNICAIKKILQLKQRPTHKGLIVIAGEFKHLAKLISPLTKSEINELNNYWPGPYSIILPTNHFVPKILTGNHNKVAVRVTKHTQVINITKYLNSALISTSANKSGKISIKNYRDCTRLFGRKALIVNGLTSFSKKPSTIIDFASKQILR